MSWYLKYITLKFEIYLCINSDRLNIPGMYSYTKIRTPSCSSTIVYGKDSGFEPGPLGIWVTFHLNPMGFSRASGIWDLSVSKLVFFFIPNVWIETSSFYCGNHQCHFVYSDKLYTLYNACAMRMSLARLPVSNAIRMY